MFLFHRPANCAFIVTVVTLGGSLVAHAQVGVTQAAPVAAVGVRPTGEVAGVTTAPVTGAASVVTAPIVGAAPIGAIGGAQASGVTSGSLLLIGQIADGQMTMEEAWNKGLLDAPKVLQLLSQTQRFTEDERNETLQRDLAGLLVKLAPSTVATPERLSARVRVALCRYYSGIGDARVVPLCETLIKEKLEGKQVNQPLASNPDGGSSSLYLSSVILLAQYYQNIDQWQKAGETWERALNFWQDKDDWQASIRLEAAHAYKRTETPENYDKAKKLYLQIARSSNTFYSGIGIINAFSQESKSNPEQAQIELLQLQKEDINPDARLATQFFLAWARYKTGDWNAFLLQSEQVLKQYENINEQSRRQILAPLVLQLEDGQKWAKLWQTNFIVAENPELNLRFDEPLRQPIERRIFVDTATPTQLQVTIKGDINRVSARIEASPWASGLEEVRHQQIVVVTITPGESKVDAVLGIESSPHKGEPLQLPLRIGANEQVAP